MSRKIYYTKPSIGEREAELVMDAVRNGWGEHCYDYIARFEKDFAKRIGVRHAVATSSCTGAIQLGLRALDLVPDDEVVMADTNWVASMAPMLHLGLRPRLVDVLPDSWCIDPEAAANAITPRTRAIMAVHLYGNLADMQRLQQIADEHGLVLIEDAAEALGSKIQGRMAGSSSRFSVFSFHGTKTLTTGEGGMLATNDPVLADRVRQLNNHGRAANDPRQFWPSELGYKFKMSNIQAALGCAQLERLDALVDRKRKIFQHYQRRFTAALPDARMNPEPTGCFNSYWMPTLVLPPRLAHRRDAVLAALRERGIDARIVFHALSDTPVGSGLALAPTPVAHAVAASGLNLPTYHDMTLEDQDVVVDAVLSAVQ
jgi:perosamine synthetase